MGIKSMKYRGLSLAFAAGALSIAAPAFATDTVVYQSVADTSSSNVDALYCSQCSYDSSKVTDTFTLGSSADITAVNLWIYASGGYDAVTSEGYMFTVSDTLGNTLFSQKVYPLSIIASRQGQWSIEDLVSGDLTGLSLGAGTYVASFFTDFATTGDQLAILGFRGGNASYTGNDVVHGGTTSGNAGYQLISNSSRNTDASGAVPEPVSWAMMVGGFSLVGATMRRRRKEKIFA